MLHILSRPVCAGYGVEHGSWMNSGGRWQPVAQASEALGVRQPQPLVSLGFDIARQFEAAGVMLDVPDARLLRPRLPNATVELVAAAADRLDLRFSFDF